MRKANKTKSEATMFWEDGSPPSKLPFTCQVDAIRLDVFVSLIPASSLSQALTESISEMTPTKFRVKRPLASAWSPSAQSQCTLYFSTASVSSPNSISVKLDELLSEQAQQAGRIMPSTSASSSATLTTSALPIINLPAVVIPSVSIAAPVVTTFKIRKNKRVDEQQPVAEAVRSSLSCNFPVLIRPLSISLGVCSHRSNV